MGETGKWGRQEREAGSGKRNSYAIGVWCLGKQGGRTMRSGGNNTSREACFFVLGCCLSLQGGQHECSSLSKSCQGKSKSRHWKSPALSCLVFALIALVSLLGSGCSRKAAGARGGNMTSNSGKTGPAVRYVAVGDSTGVGVGSQHNQGYAARIYKRIEQEHPG